MFVQGQVYRRRTLHSQLGGQAQSGISTPAHQKVILLFTGASGQHYGYSDRWTDEGVFFYTGEGQRGDMVFTRGNSAIRDHALNGKDIHLFSQVRPGFVRYEASMVFSGFHYFQAPDLDGEMRQAIVFELLPLDEFDDGPRPVIPERQTTEGDLRNDSLTELRNKALSASTSASTPVERKAVTWLRSRAIKLYVEKRADGTCEGCKHEAPFSTQQGRPYLETHHIRRLSDGGPDHPRWVVALCPNCHRRAHYADDGERYNQRMADIAGLLEADS